MISLEKISKKTNGLSTFAHCEAGEPLAIQHLFRSVLPDGSFAIEDDDGNIIFFSYANGVTVRRHQTFVVTRTENGEAWVSGPQGTWSRIN